MKEWRIDLVNARTAKGGDPEKRKMLNAILTVNVLRSIRISDPEEWSELKRFIKEAET